MQPNRIAVWLTAAAGLLGAIAVPVANLDTTSTVGVLGGLTAIAAVVVKWLDGWQAHEVRVASDGLGNHILPPTVDPATITPDQGDAGSA